MNFYANSPCAQPLSTPHHQDPLALPHWTLVVHADGSGSCAIPNFSHIFGQVRVCHDCREPCLRKTVPVTGFDGVYENGDQPRRCGRGPMGGEEGPNKERKQPTKLQFGIPTSIFKKDFASRAQVQPRSFWKSGPIRDFN